MQAGLALRFDRGPDFFALLEAHSRVHETWLLLERRRILGMGSLVLRQGYVAGAPEPVVYFSDLRMSPDRRIAGVWRRLLHEIAAQLSTVAGVRYGYCCIIRDNRVARRAVLRTREDSQVRFAHLRGYATVSILARKPFFPRSGAGIAVRRATEADSGALRRFIDAESRKQVFGTIFDDATWRHRMTLWPKFGIENFYLAFQSPGDLAGCLAPWDYSAIKRIVIDRMPASVNIMRELYNALTPLTGKPTITSAPNCTLPDLGLTHVFIRDRNPAVFSALLDRACRDAGQTKRYATVSLCLYDNDPLRAVLHHYWHYAVPMDLYAVHLGPVSEPLSGASIQVPGFEMALV